MTHLRRTYPVLLLIALWLTTACSGGGDDETATGAATSGDGSVAASPVQTEVTRAFDDALRAEPAVAKVASQMSALVVEEDADSPIAASLLFAPDSAASRVDFYGPKVATGQPADYAIVQLRDSDETVRVELGPDNLPESAQLRNGDTLQFIYAPYELRIDHTAADGTVSTFSTDLDQSTAAFGLGGALVSALPGGAATVGGRGGDIAPAAASSVSINRGVRLDAVVQSDGPLPAGIAPTVRTSACTALPELTCSFWSVRNGNTWSIGITHTGTSAGEAVPAPDWPDIASCNAARAELANWGGGLAASTIAPAAVPALAEWLGLLSAQTAATAATAPAAVLAGTVGAVFFTIGVEFGEFLHGDVDCSAVMQRSGLASGLLTGLRSRAFTVEVCFPDLPTVRFDTPCQSVGPYLPFDGQVELGQIAFRASPIASAPTISAFSVGNGNAGESIAATVSVVGGEGPLTYEWSAPDATNPAGDVPGAEGTNGFTFDRAGRFPITITVTDAEGRVATKPATTRIFALVDVTGLGAVSASTVYSDRFNAALAVDGSVGTSWFSQGPNGEGRGVSVFSWFADDEFDIGQITITGNGLHGTTDFRTGFGFDVVTVQIIDIDGEIVWEDVASLPGTPDPTVTFTPRTYGRKVVLIFGGHEDPTCGGFSELNIEAWTDGS